MRPLEFINKVFAIIFILNLGANFFLANTTQAFNASISAKTYGEPYPHILKKQIFTLNTRNIKVLNSQGRHLWMGTELGAIQYDTHTLEDYEVYDNQNHLLSNGIFSIAFDSNNLPWIGTY
ncbi:MAG: hypothetical protein F3739_08745, partial [Nitrospinae bacterium]|nr:hypothetical protein [Nitrospinota bacterium]